MRCGRRRRGWGSGPRPGRAAGRSKEKSGRRMRVSRRAVFACIAVALLVALTAGVAFLSWTDYLARWRLESLLGRQLPATARNVRYIRGELASHLTIRFGAFRCAMSEEDFLLLFRERLGYGKWGSDPDQVYNHIEPEPLMGLRKVAWWTPPHYSKVTEYFGMSTRKGRIVVCWYDGTVYGQFEGW